MGIILLEGGAEFGGAMREPDTRAIELAGGFDAPIRIIPTAAAPDNNHVRAGMNGLRWFRALGARDVESLPLIDRSSAGDTKIADSLRKARLIYLLGGFTHFLGQTLMGSRAWRLSRMAPSLPVQARGRWCCASTISIPGGERSSADWTWCRIPACYLITTPLEDPGQAS